LIEVKNLTKRYGTNLALDHVSFTIEKGHVYGFLGPNGAGKSTTMNIITGCLAATEGSVTIDGYDIFEDAIAAKQRIGYLPELPPLYIDMTPREYLSFVGRAKRISGASLREQIEKVMEETQITHVADRLIRNLSKGYKQRVGIAQALLGNPDVVILDEPTVGLDPYQIIEIRDLIRSLSRDHTVILSSHILQEISAVCDYVIIISRGRIVASDTIYQLQNSYAGNNILKVDSRGDAAAIRDALSRLSGVIAVTVREYSDHVHAEIEVSKETDIREAVFRVYADLSMPILHMSSGEISLEDIFLKLTEEMGNDNDVSVREITSAESLSSAGTGDENAYQSLFSTKGDEEN